MKKLLTLAMSVILGVGVIVGAAACAKEPAEKEAPGATSLGLRVGTLQTDDLLPLWVAEQQGLIEQAGLPVKIMTFQSAQEQIAAVTAGEIDAIMTDMVVGAQLSASGVPMKFVTVMQNAPAGIVAGAGTGIKTAADLAGVETGCSSPTILEYIYDRALAAAGVPDDQIVTTEIKKLPVRLQMLTAGQIKAAVLPWTLYQLAIAQGGVPVAGLDQVGGYTSTVLAFRASWLSDAGAGSFVTSLLKVWDEGVAAINANPDAQRALLAAKANLPAPLDTTYQVRHYPNSGRPDATQVADVIEWMSAKGYLTTNLSPGDLVWPA